MAYGKYLSDEQISLIVDLYLNTDKEIKEIALDCAISTSGVMRVISSHNIPRRKRQIKTHNKNINRELVISKYLANIPISEIMKSEDVSWSGVFTILKEEGVRTRGLACGDSMSMSRPGEKRCNKCDTWKSHSDFTVSPRYIGGLLHKCKECIAKDIRKSKVNNPKLGMLNMLRGRAKKRGFEFNLTESDIIIPSFCPVLGIPIKFNVGLNSDDSISVDRIDNSKGYISGNIVIISRRANTLKSSASLNELERIYLFYKNLDMVKKMRAEN